MTAETHGNVLNIDPQTPYSRLRFIKDLYGPLGVNLVSLVHDGGHPVQDELTAVDHEFFIRLYLRYGGDIKAGDFYMTQLAHSNSVVTDLVRLVTPRRSEVEADAGVFGLRDEVSYPSDSPADRLILLAGNTDEVLRHQLRVGSIAAEVAGSLHRRNEVLRVGTRISDMQKRLDTLWRGPTGTVMDLPIYSLHDNVTNDLIGHASLTSPKRPPRLTGEHFKVQSLGMRYCEKRFKKPVICNPHKKEMSAAVRKAIRKGLRDPSRYIDPLAAARDIMRMLFVIVGNDHDVENFMDIATGAFMQPTRYDIIGSRVVKYVDDNKRGIANVDDRFRRRNFYFDDLPNDLYFETMFYTVDQYLADQWSVGTFNEHAQRYSGSAHSLYALYREYPVLRLMFPSEVYKANFRDWTDVRQHEIAEDLIYGNRLQP